MLLCLPQLRALNVSLMSLNMFGQADFDEDGAEVQPAMDTPIHVSPELLHRINHTSRLHTLIWTELSWASIAITSAIFSLPNLTHLHMPLPIIACLQHHTLIHSHTSICPCQAPMLEQLASYLSHTHLTWLGISLPRHPDTASYGISHDDTLHALLLSSPHLQRFTLHADSVFAPAERVQFIHTFQYLATSSIHTLDLIATACDDDEWAAIIRMSKLHTLHTNRIAPQQLQLISQSHTITHLNLSNCSTLSDDVLQQLCIKSTCLNYNIYKYMEHRSQQLVVMLQLLSIIIGSQHGMMHDIWYSWLLILVLVLHFHSIASLMLLPMISIYYIISSPMLSHIRCMLMFLSPDMPCLSWRRSRLTSMAASD